MTTTTTVDQVLAKPYRRLLTPDLESGGFTATIHEFPGCVAHGDSPNSALDNLNEAAESWIEAAQSTGYPIPEPADYSDFSGKIALRISRRLHKMASERAELEAISTNQLLSTAIAHYLGQADAFAAAVRGLQMAAIHVAFLSRSTPSTSFIANDTDRLLLPDAAIFKSSNVNKVNLISTQLISRHTIAA